MVGVEESIALADRALTLISMAAVLLCGYSIARLWKSRVASLTVFGVASYGALTAAFHLLGTVAASLRKPVVGPAGLAVTTILLCVGAYALSRSARRPAEEKGLRRHPKPSKSASAPVAGNSRERAFFAALAILGCFFLANALAGVLSGPPRGWDVLAYHLPRAVAWLQHGDLGHYGANAAFFPGNGELLLTQLLFTGSDRLIGAVQLPFAVLGSAAVFGLARELGATRRSAALSGFIFTLSPIVFFQTTIAKNDLVLTALVLSGAFLLCRSLRDGTRYRTAAGAWDVALSGLAFGLALGTKYTIFPLVACTVPLVFVMQAARHRTEPLGLRRAVALTGTFVAALAVPSAFWFVQNWVVAGNPVAPLSVKLAGVTFWQGIDVASVYGEQQFHYVADVRSWWLFPWLDRTRGGSYSGSAGFGAAFATFAIPGLILCLTSVLRRVSTPLGPRLCRITLCALVILGAATWWFGGFHLPRYLLPAVALALPTIAIVLDAVTRRARQVLTVILALALAFSALEALRVLYREDDISFSMLPRHSTKAQFYHIPALIRALPPGTKIMLVQATDHEYYATFRYPLVGNLPGNEIVMERDVGVGFSVLRDGPQGAHGAFVRENVQYIFIRTFAIDPYQTTYDQYPELYAKVFDRVEEPYPWHRKGAPLVTKIYRVVGSERSAPR